MEDPEGFAAVIASMTKMVGVLKASNYKLGPTRRQKRKANKAICFSVSKKLVKTGLDLKQKNKRVEEEFQSRRPVWCN
ncbi:MAG: hypothetical protein IPN56_16325 [Chitinophagaceae bacterium]|nr:hypothetical protein [Chitinophagaceae bacterium]